MLITGHTNVGFGQLVLAQHPGLSTAMMNAPLAHLVSGKVLRPASPAEAEPGGVQQQGDEQSQQRGRCAVQISTLCAQRINRI